MSGRGGVLAVMDRAGHMIHGEFQTTNNPDPSSELTEARAAVAELIEAAPALTDYLEGYLEWQAVEGNDDVGYEIAKNDIARFRAALARVQGGAA